MQALSPQGFAGLPAALRLASLMLGKGTGAAGIHQMSKAAVRAAAATNTVLPGQEGLRLVDALPKALVDDIFSHALKKQTGVSLKYMLDFGANPIERQLLLSAQFLHKELPVRLAHRVAELENLPYGLSAKSNILLVSYCFMDTMLFLSAPQTLSSIALGCCVSVRGLDRTCKLCVGRAYMHAYWTRIITLQLQVS